MIREDINTVTIAGVTLVNRLTFVLPVTSTLVGTRPNPKSKIFQLTQQMNQYDFPSINVVAPRTGQRGQFESGHLQSQAYGGEGNDSNCVPMTRSLNQLFERRFEGLVKKVKNFSKPTNAKVRIEIRNKIETIESYPGKVKFPLVTLIRVNVQLLDGTSEENIKFDKLFGKNSNFQKRTTKVTIQLTNKRKSGVVQEPFSSQTVEDDESEEVNDDDYDSESEFLDD